MENQKVSAFEQWYNENNTKLRLYKYPKILVEQIFHGGVISERDNVLDLIQRGVLITKKQ